MSTQEIIAELPKLTRPELEAVEARLQQLLGRPPVRLWGEAMAEFAGVVNELPADYASNHDHYLRHEQSPVADALRGAVQLPQDFDERAALTAELARRHG